jgi:hypothetical protein
LVVTSAQYKSDPKALRRRNSQPFTYLHKTSYR